MPAEDIHRKSADGSGQESDGIGADAGPSRQNVFVADALAGDRKALAVLIEIDRKSVV